jgi:hypothetical protein
LIFRVLPWFTDFKKSLCLGLWRSQESLTARQKDPLR